MTAKLLLLLLLFLLLQASLCLKARPANSVGVVLDVHALRSSGILVGCGTIILTHLRLRVGRRTLEELGLCADRVIVLACPNLEGGVLQGARIGEGDMPRVRRLIHR